VRQLVQQAEAVATLLMQANQTVVVSESSAGGLIMASLLAVPGASAYCLGGVVLYRTSSWHALRDFDEADLQGFRPATRENALIRARFVRERFGATWGVGETGAAGPSGNRYGDPAGHTCIGVAGPYESTMALRTNSGERIENMHAFTLAALRHFGDAIRVGNR
jgi:nicotinamide-nucleotide amidase